MVASVASSLAQSARHEPLRLGRGTTTAVAWRPDGTLIAVGGNGGLWLYDERFHLRAHLDEHPIWDLAWRSDGQRLASAGPQGTTIWDTTTQAAFPISSLVCSHIAWQPDGAQLACGTKTGTLYLWDSTLDTFQPAYHHTSPITALAWRADGDQLASSDTAGEIRVWDVATARLEARLQTHTPTTTALIWGPHERLFSVTEGHLFAWDVTADQDIRELEAIAEMAGLMDAALNPEGTLLAALSAERLFLIDVTTLAVLQSIPLESDNPFPPEQPLKVRWGPDGAHMLIARLAEVVMLRWADATIVAELKTHTAAVNALAWSPDGRWIASAHGDPLGRGGNRVRIWDAQSGTLQATCRGHSAAVNTLDWSVDGTQLVSSSSNVNSWRSAVLVHNVPTCTLLAAHEAQSIAFAAAWNSDAHIVLQEGSTLGVWDALLGVRLTTLDFPQQNCCSTFALSADDTRLAIGLTRGTTDLAPTIQIRDARSLDLQLTLSTRSAGVITTLAWSSDSSLLASASEDRTITLWHTRTGALLRTLREHPADITALAWRPHSLHLASADKMGTVWLWNAETGQVLATFDSEGASIRALAWSPDGQYVAIGSENGTVRIWGVPVEED